MKTDEVYWVINESSGQRVQKFGNYASALEFARGMVQERRITYTIAQVLTQLTCKVTETVTVEVTER